MSLAKWTTTASQLVTFLTPLVPIMVRAMMIFISVASVISSRSRLLSTIRRNTDKEILL